MYYKNNFCESLLITGNQKITVMPSSHRVIFQFIILKTDRFHNSNNNKQKKTVQRRRNDVNNVLTSENMENGPLESLMYIYNNFTSGVFSISDTQHGQDAIFFGYLSFFLGQWTYSPLICYSSIICIFFLLTGMMRSVIITLTSQVLRRA